MATLNIPTKILAAFGPITLLIEWIGFFLILVLSTGLDPNEALSMATTSSQPLPLIFGLTLTMASITYWLFSFSLTNGKFSLIPKIVFLAGITFILTGWVPYDGGSSVTNIIHNTLISISVILYTYFIYLTGHNTNQKVAKLAKPFVFLMIVSMVLSFICVHVLSLGALYAQLFTVVVCHAWTLLVYRELK